MQHTQYSKRHRQSLTSYIHLYTAQMDRTSIIIFIGAELVGSGVIEGITETSIKVKDEHYMRGVCEFRYGR
ncbi:hypothetical protein [Paenibacillus sp. An7]|uniref:hypothetical protein n=1 Tax=Paenibacillus sp. An7 TaxID=2689577 RepID=UPI00135BD349|nr:hypothetical protein [Paenibacillus sp. An7]